MGLKNRVLPVSFIIILIFVYQNCSPFQGVGDGEISLSIGETADFATVKSIFDAKCNSCHTDASSSNRFISLSNYQAILDSGTVIAGNSTESILMNSIESGSMPLNLPMLEMPEIEAIRTWIDSGAPNEGGEVANELPVIAMPPDRTIKLPLSSLQIIAEPRDPDVVILKTISAQI